MQQTTGVMYNPSHSQMGQNPELKILFYKLTWLLEACITPIFVFDGPDQPSVKRGHPVRPKPIWMTAAFQELITAFGFHIHEVRVSHSCQ